MASWLRKLMMAISFPKRKIQHAELRIDEPSTPVNRGNKAELDLLDQTTRKVQKKIEAASRVMARQT